MVAMFCATVLRVLFVLLGLIIWVSEPLLAKVEPIREGRKRALDTLNRNVGISFCHILGIGIHSIGMSSPAFQNSKGCTWIIECSII